MRWRGIPPCVDGWVRHGGWMNFQEQGQPMIFHPVGSTLPPTSRYPQDLSDMARFEWRLRVNIIHAHTTHRHYRVVSSETQPIPFLLPLSLSLCLSVSLSLCLSPPAVPTQEVQHRWEDVHRLHRRGEVAAVEAGGRVGNEQRHPSAAIIQTHTHTSTSHCHHIPITHTYSYPYILQTYIITNTNITV